MLTMVSEMTIVPIIYLHRHNTNTIQLYTTKSLVSRWLGTTSESVSPGYGHSTPVTIGGKAFCMAYAMVGIPLGLVMFQSIGERLNKFASVVIRRAKCYLRCKQTEATEMNLMMATGLLSSVIITTGAAVFSKYEGWSYFDSFYYCFVTLTTIGFGDYVALQVSTCLLYTSRCV